MNSDILKTSWAHIFYNSTEGQSTMQNQLEFSAFSENTVYLHPSVRKDWTPITTSLFSYHSPLSSSILNCQLLPLLELNVHLSLVFMVDLFVLPKFFIIIKTSKIFFLRTFPKMHKPFNKTCRKTVSSA